MMTYRLRWEEGTKYGTEMTQFTHRSSVPIQLFIKETVIFVKQSFFYSFTSSFKVKILIVEMVSFDRVL
jgi:hypothetical protein